MILQDRGDVVPLILDHFFSDLPLRPSLGTPVLGTQVFAGQTRAVI